MGACRGVYGCLCMVWVCKCSPRRGLYVRVHVCIAFLCVVGVVYVICRCCVCACESICAYVQYVVFVFVCCICMSCCVWV